MNNRDTEQQWSPIADSTPERRWEFWCWDGLWLL